MKTIFLKTKKEIAAWLDKYNITDYELVKDQVYGYIINIQKSVGLSEKDLTKIPVKFNKINGHFDCSANQLPSLEFCPTDVGVGFYCSKNQNLGNAQNISNFSDILKLHKETLIKIEKEKLQSQLNKINAQNKSEKLIFKV